MQPSFLKFLPVTINVGIWAFLWLWIGLRFELPLWVPFVGWALWYSIGPTLALRTKRFPKNLIAAAGGTVYAVVFILLIPVFTSIFGGFAIPVLGFLAGMSIVLLELTKWFEWAVGYFFVFAGYFAFAFAGETFGATGEFARDIPYYFILILVGFGLGFITDTVRFKILRAEGLRTEAEMKTIFDTETPSKQPPTPSAQ